MDNSAATTPARIALITGVGRRVGIAATIANRLAADGWDVAITFWSPYDERMPWGPSATDVPTIAAQVRSHGGRVLTVPADLTDPASASAIFDAVEAGLGTVSAIVLCHAESVDSGILDTSVGSFDRHFAVNTRASWLLIREFGLRFVGEKGTGRIVALTSDHTVFNLPYGASKGALDRIVVAAAREFAELGITSNVLNPGPIDTGWMTPEVRTELAAHTPGGQLGTPTDTASLVSFLLSQQGRWVNGQLLKSDGGFSAP